MEEKGNLWLAYGGALIKCAPEQLRLATPAEVQGGALVGDDLKEARDRMSHGGGMRHTYLDLTQAGRPPSATPGPEGNLGE